MTDSVLDSSWVEPIAGEGRRKRVQDFYSTLYSENHTGRDPVDSFLHQLELRFSEEGRTTLEGDLLLEELEQTNAASPWLRPLEVMGFSGVLRQVLGPGGPCPSGCISGLFQGETSPTSMRGGCINLLFKKKGEKQHIKNWHLNVYYKILSIALLYA